MPGTPRLDDDLVGTSDAMCSLRSSIRTLALVPTTVLITGETGTGKSQVARLLHVHSPRSAQPFVRVDCAALPSSLIEAELFGHEPGAFTGAIRQRRGRAERAGAGTLFFDEIGELAPPLQAKLLSLIEERSFERLGSERSIPLRARIVAATHVDLREAVAARRFRADLYYRLAVASIRVGALRERPEDVKPLAIHLAAKIGERAGRAPPRLGDDVLEALQRRAWPGNVRELANAIERWLVLGEIGPDDSSLERGSAHAPAEADPGRIRQALSDADGNIAGAARALDMPRTTLRRQIQRLGLAELVQRGPQARG